MNKEILGILAILTLFTAGCTAIRESDANHQERLLAAAGFQARSADTPKKLQALATRDPYKLHTHTRKNGQIYYYYADPKKELLYVGGPSEYSKYSALLTKENMINQESWVASQSQWDDDAWNEWGPWDFGGVMAPLRTYP
jgi:hypothetical protein